jgi:glutamyl-tRNA reductase
MSGLRGQHAVPTIRELRTHAEQVRAQTLEQALKLVGSGRSAEDALTYLADTLTHRLVHPPTHALRQAGEAGDEPLIAAARRLFQLDSDSE